MEYDGAITIIVFCALMAAVSVVLGMSLGMGIEELSNRISKTDLPCLGFKRITSYRDRVRLACRIRGLSRRVEAEYIAAIKEEENNDLLAAIVITLWVVTGLIMTMLHIPTLVSIIMGAVEFIIVFYIMGEKDLPQKYENGQVMKKCEKCRVVRLESYRDHKRMRVYATVRMSDGAVYCIIPVINCEIREKDRYLETEGIVYSKLQPFALCVIRKSSEV